MSLLGPPVKRLVTLIVTNPSESPHAPTQCESDRGGAKSRARAGARARPPLVRRARVYRLFLRLFSFVILEVMIM